MRVIGITGPSGAGKTTALSVVESLGGMVLDCDRIYHDLLGHYEPMRTALTDRFGTCDRVGLGAIVFSDPSALAELNGITHPFVVAAVTQRLDEAKRAGCPLAAIDAIALIESGLGAMCDMTLAILAPRDERIARIMARERISEARAASRIDAQQSDDFFRANCTHTLYNTGTQAAFAEEVRAFLGNPITS